MNGKNFSSFGLRQAPKDTRFNKAIKKPSIDKMAELGSMPTDELAEKKIIFSATPNQDLLNTFREIRTQLLKRSHGKNFVVMVSSMCRNAGTSMVATNLGAVLALEASKTALLIDCNLYDPSLGQLLDVAPDYGITDYLAEDHLEPNDIIYASGIPRLRVVPVGTHIETGAEYFSSQRMADFIQALKQRYPDRFVVLDTPPVGLTAEARILSECCDYAVLVVPYGMVTEKQVASAIDVVGEEKIAGLIFNN